MACGEIGLSIDQFYSCTPRQFYNIQKGYFKKQERLENSSWLRARVISYFVYAVAPTGKKTRKKSFSEFERDFFNVKEEYMTKKSGVSSEEKKLRAREFWAGVEKLN